MKDASVVPAARILVIEDNGSDVFLLDRALKKQDLRFELVHLLSGTEALAFVRGEGAYADAAIPDLILVDLNLSKYTGEDILREIRSARHLDGVPVCVWSSSRSRRDEALLKELGISQFITKPAGSGSIHGDRQDHQGSAGRFQSCLTVSDNLSGSCEIGTAVQCSQLDSLQLLGPATRRYRARVARRVLDYFVVRFRRCACAYGRER